MEVDEQDEWWQVLVNKDLPVFHQKLHQKILLI